MEGIILLAAIAVIMLPVVAILITFATHRTIKQHLGDMRTELARISTGMDEIKRAVRSPDAVDRPDKPPIAPQMAVKAAEQQMPASASVSPAMPAGPQQPSPPPKAAAIPAQSVAGTPSAPAAPPPPKPELSPAPKSPFRESVENAVAKIWNWLIVGEEYRNHKVSMEFAVASTWLLRVGIVALVVCVGYFLRWSIDQGLLGPAGRVALSVLAGLAMLVAGVRNVGKKYHLLGQGFLGGGLACLYFAMYAAGPMYSLVPTAVAFGLMCLVTITAGVLAVVTESQLVAILGIIGGYATPVMLRTNQPNLPVLYLYLLLMGLGVLGITHRRQWRLLNYLAFVFSWGIFLGSLGNYRPEIHFTMAMVFLSLLFVLHSAIVYFYNIVRKKQSTVLEVIHLLLNGLLFAGISYHLIVEAWGRPWPAVMCIALAVFYVAHITVFLRNRISDRPLLITLLALAGFFTALAVPIITERESMTICWALLAFFFLWTGQKLRSNVLKVMSSALYLLVIGRLTFLDIPRNFAALDWMSRPPAAYWKSFFGRFWTFGISIVSFFASAVLYRRQPPGTPAIGPSSDIEAGRHDGALGHAAFWIGVTALFTVAYLEFSQMFSYLPAFRTPVLTCLWALLGLYLLRFFLVEGKAVYRAIAICILVVAVGKLLFVDAPGWSYGSSAMTAGDHLVGMLVRTLDWWAVLVMIYLFARAVRGGGEAGRLYSTFKVAGTALLFLYASLETNALFRWLMPAFRTGAISVLWALFAICYIIIGIRNAGKGWRYAGLVIFGVVVVKVFLSDLAGMETIYRVLAFMLVGLLLIAGSFVYIRASRHFTAKEVKQ